MQTDKRLFDDLARVAQGAIGTLQGVRGELDARLREQVTRFLSGMNLVEREEFEVVKALAQNARAENERLEARLAALETRLAATAGLAATKDVATPPEAPSAGV